MLVTATEISPTIKSYYVTNIRLTARLDIVILWHYCCVVLVRPGQLLLGVVQAMLPVRPPALAVDLDSTVRFCGRRYS